MLENVSALQRIQESRSGKELLHTCLSVALRLRPVHLVDIASSDGDAGTENGGVPESSTSHEPELSRRDQIVQAAGDALAEALDKQHGGEVTDHEVFRCSTMSHTDVFWLLPCHQLLEIQPQLLSSYKHLQDFPGC